MSMCRLVESMGKALGSLCTHLFRLALVLVAIFLLALWACGAARLHSDQRPQRKQAKRGIWRHQRSPLAYEGVMLRLERALYRLVIVPLVAFLPAPLAYGMACLRGDLRYRWDKSRREQVMYCLERILGDQLSSTERASVTRDFFRLRSCQPLDVMRLAGKARALARLVEIRGLEHIDAALAAGNGAILCSAHFGNFNCGLSLIGARGFPITVIGRWTSNVDPNRSSIERFFYRLTDQKLLERHRRRPNIEPLGQIEVAVQAAIVLRQNELIAIGLDAPLVFAADRERGVPMEFLNGRALLLPGVTTIAQLMRAPVLMTFMHRSADWRHQVLEILPPLPLDGDAVTALRRCLAVAEVAIRRNPAHWAFWDFFSLVTLGLLPEETMSSLI